MGTTNIHPAIISHIYEYLHDDYSMRGGFGWLGQYLELQNKYAEVISAIQNGFGNITRSENEDPAEILKELREVYNISASECSEMTYFVKGLFKHEECVDRTRCILKDTLVKAGIAVEEYRTI